MVRARDSVGELEIHSSTDNVGREPGFLDLTGREIGRYRIQQRLGRGGVTTVYQAYDTVDDMPVALKVLLHGNDEKLYNRFRQEAQTAAKLQHPHIVRTLRVGVTPNSDTAYIAMELVEGEDLAAMLATRRRITAQETCQLLHPIALALSHAHDQGIVHRDVKPSNILLRTTANEDASTVRLDTLDYPVVPLLGDFGIARALDRPEMTSLGRTVGTPAFMAPEQAQGQRNVDQRADIYALGAVFFRCVTGRPPFSGTTVQVLHAHVYDSIQISDEVQRNLSQRHLQLLQRSLSKDPDDRYPDARAMAEDLLRGADPAHDVLSVEEEISDTLTLELLAMDEAATVPQRQNILIPAAAIHNPMDVVTVTTTKPTPSQTQTQSSTDPVDPHFDSELDSKLQFVVWVVLTILALALVAYLLYSGLNLGTAFPPSDLFAAATTGSATAQTNASETGAQQASVSMPSDPSPIGTANLGPQLAADLPPELLAATKTHAAAATVSFTVTTVPTSSKLLLATAPSTPPPKLGILSTLEHSGLISDTQYLSTTIPLSSTSSPILSPLSTQLPILASPTTPTPSANPANTAEASYCLPTIDERLSTYIETFTPELRASFQCAIAESMTVRGQYLYFQSGEMIYLPGLEKMFVSYTKILDGIDAPWEDFTVNWLNRRTPAATPFPLAPEDGLFYPTGVFLQVWGRGAIPARLGYAELPISVEVSLIVQKFSRGWLILRQPAHNQERPQLYIYPIESRLL